MKKKRGGQRKHWAEEARVWVWYREIKRRCDWSDYVLDNKFAWTEEGKPRLSNVDRPRTFEWIRKAARKPAGLDRRWRSMAELVAAVDRHPQFASTQALYEAELWDLIQETTVTPETVIERVGCLMRANQLTRLDPDLIPGMTALIIKYGRGPVFDRCLRLSLREMDRLPGIALVWSLYQQTEPAHSYSLRAVIEIIADKKLDDFFADYLPDESLRYYSNAIDVLLRTRLDISGQNVAGYGRLGTVGTWPILPEALIGTISESHLFSQFEQLGQ